MSMNLLKRALNPTLRQSLRYSTAASTNIPAPLYEVGDKEGEYLIAALVTTAKERVVNVYDRALVEVPGEEYNVRYQVDSRPQQ